MNRNAIKNSLKIIMLILGDMVAFYLSLYLAYQSRLIIINISFFDNIIKIFYTDYVYVYFPFSYLLEFWWLPVFFIGLFIFEGLYTNRLPFWEETKEIIRTLTIAILISVSFIFFGKFASRTSALAIVFLFVYSIVLFPFFRLLIKKIMSYFSIGLENIIILGAGKKGIETAAGILKENHMGYQIIGFLDDDPGKTGGSFTILGKEYPVFDKIENFNIYLKKYKVTTAVISIPSLSTGELSELSGLVQKYVKHLFIVPDVQGIALQNTELIQLFNDERFLLKVVNNFKFYSNRIIKRLFETVLTILILPFVLPLVLFLSIGIMIDSKGGVFFFQDRIGRNGKIFKCIKFRTMFINNDQILNKYLEENPESAEEWSKYKKLKDFDPRVTFMGKILRKTSLDELPQIFNVLKGQMSLIGPRPYIPAEKADMREYYDIIILTRPGISGLWQVSGRNELEFEKRLKLDSWYILNWSVWLDIVILLKTVKVVLKREGAY